MDAPHFFVFLYQFQSFKRFSGKDDNINVLN